MPATGGPFPVVLVVQEIFGVHEHIKDVCRRFAKLGYFAIAPELYARQGDVSKLKSIDEIRAIVAKVPDEQVMSDLDACCRVCQGIRKGRRDATRHHGLLLGRAHRLAVCGAQQAAQGGRGLVRTSGRRADASCQPKHPVNIAADLQAPVLGLYAGKDQGIPLESVEQMRKALKAAKVDCGNHGVSGCAARLPCGLSAYRTRKMMRRMDGGRLLAWFKKYGVA